MDENDVRNFLEPFSKTAGWASKCIMRLKSGDLGRIAKGLVGAQGTKPVRLENGVWDVWGIDLSTCHEYCSRSNFPMQFSFQTFSAGSTNYLLPWLGLTAQLPYETGSSSGNFMSFCLALGSPMLISFSLMVTVLNAHWATSRFHRLLHPPAFTEINDLHKGYHESVRAALHFLQESQQAPIRILQHKGQFSSLVVLPENRPWWLKLKERLSATRRPVTFSLIAQTMLAVIAWLFTIAASYGESVGDPAEALLLSSGTLWIWLVPVVTGWVLVGTQANANTIEEALDAQKAYQAPLSGAAGKPYPVPISQRGLLVRSGLTIPPHPNPTLVAEINPADTIIPPGWRGGNINGDEKNQAPIFNYARIFTWWQLAETVASAFEATLTRVERDEAIAVAPEIDTRNIAERRGRTSNASDYHNDDEVRSSRTPTRRDRSQSPVRVEVSLATPLHPSSRSRAGSRCRSSSGAHSEAPTTLSEQYPRPQSWARTLPPTEHSAGGEIVSEAVARYCGLDKETSVKAYPEWSDLDSSFWKKIAVAVGTAVFIQWGTTGAAMVISYLTEVRGLACRSGSYLLYGVLSTATFILLLSSAFLSHQAMLLYQREFMDDGGRYADNPRLIRSYVRSTAHECVCALAVITRVAGKWLAAANALWLILTSLWELVGFFDSCWCTGGVLHWGSQAWVVLFKTSIELRDRAEPSWIGGIAMSSLVCFITMIVLSVYSKRGIT
ncbi:hypothetical protein AJ79_09011 [Helicocarpus griseus UAMH5409]|uniref:Transmembrane protein n=1 Tax=Helicocarpus griseus UAMH5409 TaxID=1447875 RepID=A0A2B7WN97_9EURO|nr:hypothetical protein AJ79_09011 [Helicocarpus griseus UAMH5409]